MKIVFTAITKDLLEGLNRVRTLQPRTKHILQSLSVELDMYAEFMVLTCTGASVTVRYVREDIQQRKVSVPLDHFYQIVKTYPNKDIIVSFEGSKMTCGNITIGGVIIADLEEPLQEAILKLPVNYTDRDLLKLRGQIKDSELRFSGIYRIISEAESRLEVNLSEAYSCLKLYGVSKKDLIDLVSNRLSN